MQNRAFFRGFFLVAALYDLILGVAFFFLYPWVYGLFGIALPTEPAYLHVAAAFVFTLGRKRGSPDATPARSEP